MQRIRRSTKLNDIKTKAQSSQVSGACLFLRIHNDCINILYFDVYVRFSDIKESLTLLKFLQYYANNINYKHKHLSYSIKQMCVIRNLYSDYSKRIICIIFLSHF